MLHHYNDNERGESYKSVGVRLDLDGKLNYNLSTMSIKLGIGKKNIIETILSIVIADDIIFSTFNPRIDRQTISVYEGFCPVGVSIQLDAFLNYRMTTLSKKTGINKKELLISVLEQFNGSKAILDLLKQKLSIRAK